MSASNKTCWELYKTFKKHIPQVSSRYALLVDIKQNVRGNQSFEDTIDKLLEIIKPEVADFTSQA